MYILKKIIALVPFKKLIVQHGSSLKTNKRTRLGKILYSKLATSLCREIDEHTLIITNLGIKDDYKIQMPLKTLPTYLFSTPENYVGERCVLFLSKYLQKSCDAIADIGANWGYYTYFLANYTEKPIYFFEPNITLYENITQNVAKNNLFQVKGYDKAISNKSGEVRFNINLSDDSSSSLTNYFENHGHKIKEVVLQALSFDDFAAQHTHKKWLVKVDIEDAEFQFMEGADKSLANGTIKYLIIELLENARKNNFVDKMIEKGWVAYYLNDYRIEYVSKEDGRYTAPEYNWLFCQEKPQELRTLLAHTEFSVIE
jgi:FkbM family methyltransferase